MTNKDEADQAEILARLAQSREELRRLLDPPRKESGVNGGANPDARPEGFPRSRTMQFLLGEKSLEEFKALGDDPRFAVTLGDALALGNLGRVHWPLAVPARNLDHGVRGVVRAL